jgi:hypothetical protein
MANGLYDDGGISFIQEKIDQSRKIKEQRAKEEDKFAKRLATVDTILKGGQFFIDKRANELDLQQAWKKTSYQNYLTRSENINSGEAERIKSGVSQEDYLTDSIYQELIKTAQEDNPNLDFSAARNVFKNEARIIAKQRLPEYVKLVDIAKNFPKFDDFEKEYENVSEIPRTMFGWITSGIKNVARAETPESIEYKKKKAEDALYGTELHSKFSELSDSIKNYDALVDQAYNIEDIINEAKKQNLVRGKVVENLTQVKERTTYLSRGQQKIDYVLNVVRKNDKGDFVKDAPKVLNSVIVSTQDRFLSLSDIENITKLVKPEHRGEVRDILTDSPAGATLDTATRAMEYINNNPEIYEIDWADEDKKLESFDKWYSLQIMNLKHPTDTDADGNPIYLAIDDQDNKGMYKIKPEYIPLVDSLGLDKDTQLQEYNKLGTRLSLESKTHSSEQSFKNAQQLIEEDYKDIQQLLRTESSREAFRNVMTGEDPEFYQIFGPQIEKFRESNSEGTLDLGVKEMDKLFPDLGLKGNYKIVYDIESNRILIKKS